MTSNAIALAHTQNGPTSEQCSISNKYTDYIETHLEALRATCEGFTNCISKLLEDSSAVQVLTGVNISLNKTCGLVHKNGNRDYTTLAGECSPHEREEIRIDIEHHLKEELLAKEKEWKSVSRCLSNSFGDKERMAPIDEICTLAHKDKYLCDNYDIHNTVETFFNEQITHLKCTCENLNAADDHDHASAGQIVGLSVAAFLVLTVIILAACLIHKHRKYKKKKKSPNVIYLPAAPQDTPVYQEVYDERGIYQGYRPNVPSNPPSLPMRYSPHPSAASSAKEDEPAYLEPVQAKHSFNRPLPPIRIKSAANPNYGAPPKYSEHPEYSLASVTGDDSENAYFEPLPSPDKDDDTTGNGSLRRPDTASRSAPDGYESTEAARSSAPLEDAPRPELPLLGPVPAMRTKKDDRETESHYFTLERDDDDDEYTDAPTENRTSTV